VILTITTMRAPFLRMKKTFGSGGYGVCLVMEAGVHRVAQPGLVALGDAVRPVD